MTDLVNLAPLARLMLMGAVVALGPIAWLWVRSRGAPPAQRLSRLTLLTLFLTFDLVLFGDMVSLELAGQEGLDPGPVPVIDELARMLAG